MSQINPYAVQEALNLCEGVSLDEYSALNHVISVANAHALPPSDDDLAYVAQTLLERE